MSSAIGHQAFGHCDIFLFRGNPLSPHGLLVRPSHLVDSNKYCHECQTSVVTLVLPHLWETKGVTSVLSVNIKQLLSHMYCHTISNKCCHTRIVILCQPSAVTPVLSHYITQMLSHYAKQVLSHMYCHIVQSALLHYVKQVLSHQYCHTVKYVLFISVL